MENSKCKICFYKDYNKNKKPCYRCNQNPKFKDNFYLLGELQWVCTFIKCPDCSVQLIVNDIVKKFKCPKCKKEWNIDDPITNSFSLFF